MKNELAKLKLRKAFEGMAANEKYDLLTDVLIDADKVLVGTWLLGEIAICSGAKKAIVEITKDNRCRLSLVAGKGKSLHLKPEEE